MQDIVVTLLTGMLSSKALPGLLSCFPWISYHMELGLGLVPGLPYAILQREQPVLKWLGSEVTHCIL